MKAKSVPTRFAEFNACALNLLNPFEGSRLSSLLKAVIAVPFLGLAMEKNAPLLALSCAFFVAGHALERLAENAHAWTTEFRRKGDKGWEQLDRQMHVMSKGLLAASVTGFAICLGVDLAKNLSVTHAGPAVGALTIVRGLADAVMIVEAASYVCAQIGMGAKIIKHEMGGLSRFASYRSGNSLSQLKR